MYARSPEGIPSLWEFINVSSVALKSEFLAVPASLTRPIAGIDTERLIVYRVFYRP